MGAGRQTQTFIHNGSFPPAQNPEISSACARNLRKNQLGGVIFGCKNSTLKECLLKQLFGLPSQHFGYVKNIDPGLPLFLFNYSDRKLHGIFEAASSGQMNINPYGWTADGSERTQYPAQVQIRVRLQCQPLLENQFRPIIADNFYTPNHFWFELDHAQASRLISKLSAMAVAPSSYVPQNTKKWRTLFQPISLPDGREVGQDLNPLAAEFVFPDSIQLNMKYDSSDVALCLNRDNNSLEDLSRTQAVEEDDLIYLKLKELALNSENLNPSPTGYVDDTAVTNDLHLEDKGHLEEQIVSEKNEERPVFSSDVQSVIAQLFGEIQELKAFKAEHIHKMGYLEQRLAEAEEEIQQLKGHCMMLEGGSSPSIADVDDETVIECIDELLIDPNELIYIVGGYDAVSWLSALDSYSPSHDVIKTLRPMSSARAYASVAKLNDKLYVFGGGNGDSWYDTVESYNPTDYQWTSQPSLNKKKGSLAGVTVDDKIFAVGGGNGVECFSDVEMFDSDVGRWISTRSMLQKRFALAAVELNGVLYATGGFDEKNYLKSAERFDPREHAWTKIESMNTERGCHSLVVLNEKLYALGGFDGNEMVPSVEIYDPRLGTWMVGEPMNQARGYAAAVVVKDSIYVTGGLQDNETIIDTVECYKEGRGWEVTNLRAIGKRCYASAIVL